MHTTPLFVVMKRNLYGSLKPLRICMNRTLSLCTSYIRQVVMHSCHTLLYLSDWRCTAHLMGLKCQLVVTMMWNHGLMSCDFLRATMLPTSIKCDWNRGWMGTSLESRNLLSLLIQPLPLIPSGMALNLSRSQCLSSVKWYCCSITRWSLKASSSVISDLLHKMATHNL